MALARILIVEDEVITAKDIEISLSELGFDVCAIALSGEDALVRVEQELPDLVLMDIQLKGRMDGTEAARMIRDKYHTPVVFLTAHADPVTFHKAKISGPFGYLVKPFENRELQINIETALYKAEMEARLRESEAKYRRIVETAHEGILFSDKNGCIAFMNRRMSDMLGYKESELLGRPFLDIFAPASKDLISQKMGICRKGCKEAFEVQMASRSGAPLWARISASPLTDDEGRVSGVLSMFSDISALKQGEMERDNLIGQLRSALNDVKTMSGFLPICSNCKKIRDDDGYWQQVEKYIQDHSSALFSHSICPDCAKKLYPDCYNDEE